MKIVFTADGIYAYASCAHEAVGGAERQQWYLARALAARGWKVVVGVREGVPRGTRRRIDGVEFIRLEEGHVLREWRRLLALERPDWWYWRTAGHLYGPSVGLARLAGVRTIFSTAFDRDVTPRSALSWRRRWWPLYAAGLSLADRIFLQHAGQLAALPDRWRAKARVVRSIAASEGEPAPHANRDGHVAWVGMLRQPKRPDVLVEIAQRLPLIRFVVCGGTTRHRSPGSFGEDVANKLRTMPNVTHLGQVPPERCREVVRNASVLLSTSDEEGFPNTFLEAWSNGTPVVSLNIDPEGVIEQKGLGTVSRDVARAAADISALVIDTARREAIGTRARRHVAECHSAQAVVEEFERAVDEIASRWSHERPRIAF